MSFRDMQDITDSSDIRDGPLPDIHPVTLTLTGTPINYWINSKPLPCFQSPFGNLLAMSQLCVLLPRVVRKQLSYKTLCQNVSLEHVSSLEKTTRHYARFPHSKCTPNRCAQHSCTCVPSIPGCTRQPLLGPGSRYLDVRDNAT